MVGRNAKNGSAIMKTVAHSATRILELYRCHAGTWKTARGKVLSERAWIERFLDLLQPVARVLDIECRSGIPVISLPEVTPLPVSTIRRK
ncbi:hypothetical protein G6L37_32160 [Agrobacterium rubi]|uniref:hypothetical protein n=1 Tax=Agrobacterium rubi TaxID=28099 RepID=UPI0015717E34|nr:hypothetical protein [Agrobacterium rubi]NTF10652.1 hypothetical protein [Agrobacterium rubi]NTF23046.1 hypothetical protein [Agrobacterium rubi]NTF29977.1 hypothetical protein [Agrobacterium rubi]